MKRKFFLHRQNAPMEPDHVVYRVWIGESVKEQRILTQLMAWSFETGATLRTWSEDIDFYLSIESDRVFPGRGLLDFGFISVDITAAEALQLVQTKSWDAYEKSLSLPKSLISSITLNSPSRIDTAKGRVIPSLAQPKARKYLNQSQSNVKHIIRFT